MTVAGITTAPVATLPIHCEADVSRARVAAIDLAKTAGFSRVDAYRLATAVSELGNNLVFHSRSGGTVLIAPVRCADAHGIEVVAEDDGPGIADLEQAMTDGYSTNGGLGSGLPGCRRLMDHFEIASRPGAGTRVMVRLWR